MLLMLVFCFALPAVSIAESCTYQTYEWNTLNRRAENFRSVERNYGELSAEEIDAKTGCTVCAEDQQWIRAGGAEPVRVCRRLAARFQAALDEAVASGFEIRKLVGYRVGKTRGDADANGRRTRFSNHSYGIALDINPGSNGLYGNCFSFDQACVLLRGGDWRPRQDAASITAGGRLVQSMKAAGFAWGGEIAGRQKDFMHFSPSGY